MHHGIFALIMIIAQMPTDVVTVIFSMKIAYATATFVKMDISFMNAIAVKIAIVLKKSVFALIIKRLNNCFHYRKLLV